jgi:FAD:protein FMN transferase
VRCLLTLALAMLAVIAGGAACRKEVPARALPGPDAVPVAATAAPAAEQPPAPAPVSPEPPSVPAPASSAKAMFKLIAMKNVPVVITMYGRTEETGAPDMDAAAAEIERLERILSRHRPEGTLARVNKLAPGEALEVEPELIDVLATAKRVHQLTLGCFDPTVGPLIELWQAAGRDQRLPADEAIAAARAQVGFDSVVIDGNKVRLTRPVTIDLGGVAKGYIIGKVIALLVKRGVPGGIVLAGGDLGVFGAKPDGSPFQVGVRDPADPGGTKGLVVHTLAIKSGAVLTSGSYERYVTINGVRYSHIIDPRTGRPVPEDHDLLSATIHAEDAAFADGMATGVFILGKAAGRKVIEDCPEAGGFLLAADGQNWEKLR